MDASLRPATMDDAQFLLDLKNDPDVRRFAIVSHDEIKLEDHLKWLEEHLHEIYIITVRGNKPVGDIRFEHREGDVSEVAIKIAKEWRGKGIANAIFSRMFPKKTLCAKVVDGNVASLRLFLRYGFTVEAHKEENGTGYYLLAR